MKTLPWGLLIRAKGDRAANAVPTGTQAHTCRRGRGQKPEVGGKERCLHGHEERVVRQAHGTGPWEGVRSRRPKRIAGKTPAAPSRRRGVVWSGQSDAWEVTGLPGCRQRGRGRGGRCRSPDACLARSGLEGQQGRPPPHSDHTRRSRSRAGRRGKHTREPDVFSFHRRLLIVSETKRAEPGAGPAAVQEGSVPFNAK